MLPESLSYTKGSKLMKTKLSLKLPLSPINNTFRQSCPLNMLEPINNFNIIIPSLTHLTVFITRLTWQSNRCQFNVSNSTIRNTKLSKLPYTFVVIIWITCEVKFVIMWDIKNKSFIRAVRQTTLL